MWQTLNDFSLPSGVYKRDINVLGLDRPLKVVSELCTNAFLGYWEEILPMKVTRPWHRLPKAAVAALEVSKPG